MKLMNLTPLAAAMAAFIVLGASSALAQTDTTNQQSATGTAGVNTYGTTGDTTNGGYSLTNGQGSFTATDPSKASGSANAAGTGASSLTPGTNSMTSQSKAVLHTLATGTGAQTNVSLSGSAEQGNWMNVGNGSNTYANAGDRTSGSYTGSADAAAPLTGDGSGQAQGKSWGTATGDGTNHATSQVGTTASSQGTTTFTTSDTNATPTVSSGVQGLGVANAGAVAGDASTKGAAFAGAGVQGTATYGMQNPTGATTTGNLSICGSNDAKVSNGGANVSASSVIQSTATAKP